MRLLRMFFLFLVFVLVCVSFFPSFVYAAGDARPAEAVYESTDYVITSSYPDFLNALDGDLNTRYGFECFPASYERTNAFEVVFNSETRVWVYIKSLPSYSAYVFNSFDSSIDTFKVINKGKWYLMGQFSAGRYYFTGFKTIAGSPITAYIEELFFESLEEPVPIPTPTPIPEPTPTPEPIPQPSERPTPPPSDLGSDFSDLDDALRQVIVNQGVIVDSVNQLNYDVNTTLDNMNYDINSSLLELRVDLVDSMNLLSASLAENNQAILESMDISNSVLVYINHLLYIFIVALGSVTFIYFIYKILCIFMY